ncbi:MAG: hypothetical protein LWX10_00715 [Spirochaetia bacterium]|nr:hypothetical protein [Spirochaetia bacterium]
MNDLRSKAENQIEEKIYSVISLIELNIKKYGIERYDPRDIRWFKYFQSNSKHVKIIRKFFVLMERICPIGLRKILKIKKQIWPTSLSFLGNSLLISEKYFKGILFDSISSKIIVDIIKKKYIKNEDYSLWWGSEKQNCIPEANIITNKRPKISMHELVRILLFLKGYSDFYLDSFVLNIVNISTIEILNYNQIVYRSDDNVGISYYYNTFDCTLNIQSEYAELLSYLTYNLHNQLSLTIFHSIIELLCSEQYEDGHWNYYSKWHEKKYNKKHVCDAHHSATIISNLCNISKSCLIDSKEKEKILNACTKGIIFLVNEFYKNPNRGITAIGKYRPSGPVQYSETIIALCKYLTIVDNNEISKELYNKLVLLVNRNIAFINKKGEAPSEKIIFPLNLNSIRWGNGPVLNSILEYLKLIKYENK